MSINAVRHKMNTIYKSYAKSVGLSYASILVLQILCEPQSRHLPKGHHTQKEICRRLGLPKQFVNSVVKSFWEQGYVELKEARDRRNKEIIVTEKGEAFALRVLKPLEDAEAAAWGSFSDEEIQALACMMERYIAAFEGAIGPR